MSGTNSSAGDWAAIAGSDGRESRQGITPATTSNPNDWRGIAGQVIQSMAAQAPQSGQTPPLAGITNGQYIPNSYLQNQLATLYGRTGRTPMTGAGIGNPYAQMLGAGAIWQPGPFDRAAFNAQLGGGTPGIPGVSPGAAPAGNPYGYLPGNGLPSDPYASGYRGQGVLPAYLSGNPNQG